MRVCKTVSAAHRRLCGKYCFSCQRSLPVDQFTIIKGKSIVKCNGCTEKLKARGVLYGQKASP